MLTGTCCGVSTAGAGSVGLNPGEVRGRDTARAGDVTTCDSMSKPIQDGIPRLNYYFGSPRIESESIYALVDSADGSVSVLMALPFVPIVGVRYAFALPDSSSLRGGADNIMVPLYG